jgi:hypothetical protein
VWKVYSRKKAKGMRDGDVAKVWYAWESIYIAIAERE